MTVFALIGGVLLGALLVWLWARGEIRRRDDRLALVNRSIGVDQASRRVCDLRPASNAAIIGAEKMIGRSVIAAPIPAGC